MCRKHKCRGRRDAQERPPPGDFDRSRPWLRPFGRAEARPILLLAKLSFRGQIRRERIWSHFSASARTQARDGLRPSHQSHFAPKDSPASQVPSPLVGLRRCAYGLSLSRMRTRGIPSAPLRARLRPFLVVRLAYGALNTTDVKPRRCSDPVWRARAPQGFGRVPEGTREGSRGSPSGTGRCRRATTETKPRMQGGRRAIRGSVSLGPFLSPQERSSPSGARTRLKQVSPQAAPKH